MDFDLMIHRIKNDIPFKYARYGDGEWNCILGKPGANCDGHHYFTDLGQRLKSILESRPNYFLGLQTVAIEQNKSEPEFKRLVDMNDWVDNEILHRASINDYFSLFMEAIDWDNTFIVGGSHLSRLNKRLLHIPDKSCWKNYDLIKECIEIILHKNKPKVILLCASMMSEVLIDDFKHTDHTFIDCGSVFDPYCGINSRTYHKDIIQRHEK